MLIMSLGCLQFSRESCLLYAFLLGYLPSIFCDFGEKPIDFYLQDSLSTKVGIKFLLNQRNYCEYNQHPFGEIVANHMTCVWKHIENGK